MSERYLGQAIRKHVECATIHSHDGHPYDVSGCLLADGHDGPHEFVDASGASYLWETDMDCACWHCRQCEGDYCTIYWRKPTVSAQATVAALAAKGASVRVLNAQAFKDDNQGRLFW
jgi:hypothetical protein